jgi:hypothetical protein
MAEVQTWPLRRALISCRVSSSSPRSPVQTSVFAASCLGRNPHSDRDDEENDRGSNLAITPRINQPPCFFELSAISCSNSLFAASCAHTISISRRCSIESATACTIFMYSSPSLNPGCGEIPPGDRTAAMKSVSTFQLCSTCGGIGS